MTGKIISISTLGLLAWLHTPAQVTIGGGNGMHIKSGSTVTANGMVLAPSANLSITNTTFQKSSTPAQGTGGSGISQVHTWNNPFSFQGIIGLVYTTAQLNGNTAATLQLAYRNTASGAWIPATGSAVNTTVNYVSNAFATPMQLSALTAVSAGIELPVFLSHFAATAETGKIRLDFDMDLRAGNAICTIERAADGKHFEAQQQVPLSRGAQTYSTYDHEPLQGWNHYRLSWQNAAGKNEYSVVRTAFMAYVPALRLFPIPANNQLQVSLRGIPAEGSYIRLSSMDGKTVLKRNMQSPTLTLDIAGCPAGLYLLSFYNGATVEQYKIEKR